MADIPKIFWLREAASSHASTERLIYTMNLQIPTQITIAWYLIEKIISSMGFVRAMVNGMEVKNTC